MQRIKSGSAGSAVPPQTQLPQQQALPTVNSFGAQPVHPIPENVSDVNGARRFLEHPRHETRRKLYDLPLFSGIPVFQKSGQRFMEVFTKQLSHTNIQIWRTSYVCKELSKEMPRKL